MDDLAYGMGGQTRFARREVLAWDLPTRLFHWGFVWLMASAWASHEFSDLLGDDTLKWHRWNGYAILVLVVFRLIWGFVGSSTSRLASFVGSPLEALSYGRGLLAGKKLRYLGHNPLGTWMIIALVIAVTSQGIMGLFLLDHNDVTAGPLQFLISDELGKKLGNWHRIGFKLVMVLAVLHISANTLYSLVKKDPLIRAMITGKKPAALYEDHQEAKIAPNVMLRAGLCLVLATAIVLGGIRLSGGVL